MIIYLHNLNLGRATSTQARRVGIRHRYRLNPCVLFYFDFTFHTATEVEKCEIR